MEAAVRLSGPLQPALAALTAELQASDAELRACQEHVALLQAPPSDGGGRASELTFLRTRCSALATDARDLRRRLTWTSAASHAPPLVAPDPDATSTPASAAAVAAADAHTQTAAPGDAAEGAAALQSAQQRVTQLERERDRLMELSCALRSDLEHLTSRLPPAFTSPTLFGLDPRALPVLVSAADLPQPWAFPGHSHGDEEAPQTENVDPNAPLAALEAPPDAAEAPGRPRGRYDPCSASPPARRRSCSPLPGLAVRGERSSTLERGAAPGTGGAGDAPTGRRSAEVATELGAGMHSEASGSGRAAGAAQRALAPQVRLQQPWCDHVCRNSADGDAVCRERRWQLHSGDLVCGACLSVLRRCKLGTGTNGTWSWRSRLWRLGLRASHEHCVLAANCPSTRCHARRLRPHGLRDALPG